MSSEKSNTLKNVPYRIGFENSSSKKNQETQNQSQESTRQQSLTKPKSPHLMLSDRAKQKDAQSNSDTDSRIDEARRRRLLILEHRARRASLLNQRESQADASSVGSAQKNQAAR